MSLINTTREFGREGESPEEEQFWMQVLDRYNPTDACFKCGRPLTDDLLVVVSGYDELYDPSEEFKMREIWLHVDCAHDLALRLIEDYLKVKQIRDRKKARKELGLPPHPEDEESD
jgi:hypothetical protein